MPFDTLPETHPPPMLPPRLKRGDTIGIAAPAGPFETDLFDKGMAVLRGMGFEVHIPEAIFQRNGYLAGPDEARAEVLNALFRDPGIDAILCARGGYGSTRVLPYLDWEAVRQNPKVFVGFSDITVLHSVLREQTGLVTFHGPLGTTLATAGKAALAQFRQALMSRSPVELKPSGTQVFNHGAAMGKVVGGNLSMLCHLVGTPYAPDFDGSILVLEDVNEAPYRLDRMLIQMRLAGCFDKVAGLVLGRFEGCGGIDAIMEVFSHTFPGLNIPVVAGFPVGHIPQNVTLPLGLEARLTTRPLRLRYAGAGTA